MTKEQKLIEKQRELIANLFKALTNSSLELAKQVIQTDKEAEEILGGKPAEEEAPKTPEKKDPPVVPEKKEEPAKDDNPFDDDVLPF